jgi:predicted lipoprotein with Yx(FWY)xxD motif
MASRSAFSLAVMLALFGALALSAHSAIHPSATVNVAKTRLGTILVDSRGRTLYLFSADKKGSIRCTSKNGCTARWRPLMPRTAASSGGSLNPALLSTVDRTDPFGVQVTFNGHPLYRYVGDKKPGDVRGQGLGGRWYVVSPRGTPLTKRK